MAAEYGLLSLTHLQKLAQSLQAQPLNLSSTTTSSTRMWNPNIIQPSQEEEDDSWEVRAFAEDTNHAMGTTWPPRSYTCTFCRREFRSAQALGGHMNVHRRDRARLHQTQPPVATLENHPTSSSTAALPSNALIIPTEEFVTNGGLCLLYSLPNPNNVCTMDSPSTLLSISPYPPNNLILPSPPSINFPVAATRSVNSTLCHSTNTDPSAASVDNDNNRNNDSSAIEELDLELRLGQS